MSRKNKDLQDVQAMMEHNFVVFILSHGRADRVVTYNVLRNKGYHGRVVLVIDNEDPQEELYKKNFGEENVYVFDKARVAETFDEGIRGDRRTVVYARNACFAIARDLGYRYFMELDDDYTGFYHNFNIKKEYDEGPVQDVTKIFAAMLRYFISTPSCVKSIAMGQGGDYMGGRLCSLLKTIRTKRKAMNSFICDTERPFQFSGRINEDVNTYTANSHRGEVFLTILQVKLNQVRSQSSEGGMTDVYLDTGTYLKSFFSVMYHPSGVKISTLGGKEMRIHHQVRWNNTAPKILAEKWKKT